MTTSVNDETKKTIEDLVKSTNRLLDTVKHAVILLQMARSHLEGVSMPNTEDEELNESSPVSIFLVLNIIFTSLFHKNFP